VEGEHRAGADGDGKLLPRDATPLAPLASQQEGDGDDDERESESPGGDGERVRVGEADERAAERDAEQREGEDERRSAVWCVRRS
jgi:hypothetical protein